MNEQLLMKTASDMVKKGKGILAADESTPTIGKRFSQIAVESTFESRNEYRDMLFRADNIIKDAERIRKQLIGDKKWSVLGQSFGGFCATHYLSFYPESLEKVYILSTN